MPGGAAGRTTTSGGLSETSPHLVGVSQPRSDPYQWWHLFHASFESESSCLCVFDPRSDGGYISFPCRGYSLRTSDIINNVTMIVLGSLGDRLWRLVLVMADLLSVVLV
ncbi:hypothetical protein Sjap_011517 [Stephania japonica]|uniref:Uncharacterized protein n=1 Tax=Stephania japonica TaxID=461633 RepID=A0AAP0JCJ4_9MAGN